MFWQVESMMDDDKFRLDFARKTYDEVLDATKHQDDKIGRFLTAIAFLFTGAIAFGARSDVLSQRVEIAGFARALPGIFLGLFLVLAIISVLLLLVALGPNLNLPAPERRGGPPSRLFFLSMARTTAEDWWKRHWEDDRPTPEAAVRNYVDDAHNLAIKTNSKFNRTNEARAVFTLALLFLALSVVLAFESAARSTTGTSQLLPWDTMTRSLVATTVAVFAFILAYDYLRLEQTPERFLTKRSLHFGVWPLYEILVAAPAFAVFCILPASTTTLRLAKWGSVVLVVLTAAALMARLMGSGPAHLIRWPLVYGAFAITVAVLMWKLFERANPLDLLVVSLVAVCLLETPRLFLNFWSWRRRMDELRKRAKVVGASSKGEQQEAPASPSQEGDAPSIGEER
jgi:hypothetical protein